MARRLSRIVAFLQTNLGLWMLSALALYILPFAYTSCQAKAAKAAQLKRIHHELVSRMDQWLVYAAAPEVEAKYKDDFKTYIDVLLRPPNIEDPVAPIYPVYQEFKDLSFPALLTQGSSLSDPTDNTYSQPLTNLVSSKLRYPPGSSLVSLMDRTTAFVRSADLSAFSSHRPGPPRVVGVH
jgi:hypothetical protein